MALGPRLDLRQTQSLVMTPQLQQAIRLLTLSNVELEAHIAEALERNPLLQTDGGEDSPAEPAEIVRDRAQSADAIIASGPDGNDVPMESAEEGFADQLGAADGMLGAAPRSGASGPDQYGDGADFAELAASDITLADHLLQQAGACLPERDMGIAARLIAHIDEAGYLRADILPMSHDLGVDPARVEQVLAVIQSFDPSGVGARDLAECLAIQLRDRDRYDPAMAALVANLDLLAAGKLAQLKRIAGVDEEDLSDMIAELRALDPKPGEQIGGVEAAAVIPDLFVTERGGKWQIELNNATLPRLLVDRHYYQELKNGVEDAKAKAWLNECLSDAGWLVKALDQRQRTIVKVATEIVKQQEAFFRHGVAHLKPLTLARVADAIEMHESTVSRVTSNKYLSCARGTFELKYFFTSSIASADGGDAVSAEAVKARIKALIDGESPAKILSDDKLVKLLKDEGYDIARRTVAKYREALGLGSSVQRRRQKALRGQAA